MWRRSCAILKQHCRRCGAEKWSAYFLAEALPAYLAPRPSMQFSSAVRALLPLELLAEVTLEANPGTFEAQKFADFRAAGINGYPSVSRASTPGIFNRWAEYMTPMMHIER